MEDNTFCYETGSYVRLYGHPYQIALENFISKKYFGKEDNRYVCLFPSGMAAITTTLLAIAKRYKKLSKMVFSSELYSEVLNRTIPLIENFTPHKCEIIDIWDKENVKKGFIEKDLPVISIFAESASNPHGFVPQFELLPKEPILIIDNSWLSPVLFNPFTKKADIVIESLSKYWSAGKRIGGMVISKTIREINSIRNMALDLGYNMPPSQARDILKNAQEIEKRFKKVSEKIERKVIPFLKNNNKVHNFYIWHQDTPFNEIIYPGVIYFNVYSSFVLKNRLHSYIKMKWEEWCKDLSIKVATSYGKSYDMIDMWTKPINKLDTNTIPVRLSVGHEENPSLIEDLEILIERIYKDN